MFFSKSKLGQGTSLCLCLVKALHCASSFFQHQTMPFLDEANDDEAIAFTITVWHIWEARNAARNGENMMRPHSIAERTKAYIEMVLMHSTKQPTPHWCESNCLVPKWTPPSDGWLMFNVDAATF
jgi:hypothetical protein